MPYLETWTAANGTVATTLTSDSGATYTGGSGFKVQDNRLYCDNITSPLLLISQTYPDTYELDLDIYALTLAGNAGIIAVCDGTYNDSFLIRASSTDIQMYRYVAGSPTLVGDHPHGVTAPGALPTIRVQVTPSKVALVIDSVEEIAFTGTTNSATLNRIAYRCNSATTTTTGFHVESMSEVDPDAGKTFVDGPNVLLLPSNVPATIADGSYTVSGTVIKSDGTTATDTAALSVGFAITHDAAMAHGADFVVTANNPATTPTTGNTTLTNGTVVLTPDSVTGTDPYTITFPISRLDKQEASYVWTLDINGETEDTSSLAYTIDGNGTTEFYGTVTDEDAWISVGYTEVVNGDNIYAVRTSGDTTPVLASCSFTGPSTWDIYIQDVADDVWGSPGTLTVPAADTTAPVITLTGSASIEVAQGGTYTEQGATWTDAVDGSGAATVGGDAVDESTLGTYVVTYNHTDSAGNAATQVTRSVEVVAAATAPTMPADASISVDEGTTAAGTYTASSGSSPITYTLTGTDASSFSIVEATGVVTFNAAPDYETKASYSFNVVGTNSAGSDTQAVTIAINNVLEDAPTITTTGGTTLALEVGDTYSGDPAWTAADDVGSVTVDWSGDTVDTATAGTYTRTASATNTIDTTTADYVVTVSEAGAAKVVQPTPLKVVVQRFAVSKVKSFSVYTANTRNLSFDFAKIVNEIGSSISTATFAIDSGSGVTLGESASDSSLAQVEFTTGSISSAAQVVCRAVFESGVELTAYATITVIDLPDL